MKDTAAEYENLNTRLRVLVMRPDGALFIATDVASGDGQIWRVVSK